ncbi:MAG: sigma-70 family RNA polymerase sigma factor [Clostridiales bacterium]|nr:sigma-70 family RNA polymerase sigma factor [Clostridiales bacterium]
MAEKKEYRIKVQGQLVPVSEEVYLTYHRMKRREIYLEERDTTNGVFYYSALDTEGTNGEDVIPDLVSPRVEDLIMDKLIAEKLHQCLSQLTSKEQELIFLLFFQDKSEHQVAAETGIPRMTIHDRKMKILRTLKKLMEK